MWDNIHGPKVLMTWKGTEFDDKFSSAEEDSECALVPDEKSSIAKGNYMLSLVTNVPLYVKSGEVINMCRAITMFGWQLHSQSRD